MSTSERATRFGDFLVGEEGRELSREIGSDDFSACSIRMEIPIRSLVAWWSSWWPLTCGVITYINQKDASSMVRLRPNVTQYLNGAMLLKVEQNASQEELLIARGERVARLNKDAYLVFPKDNRSIFGFASAGGLIDMVEIYVAHTGTFNAHLLSSFNLTATEGKVAFLETLMKFLRFVVTIDGPNQSFHLIPGSRRQTPNGHHVTWIREGLLKEYGRLQSPQQMELIQAVYEANLAHVEHGVVENRESKVALITRVGRQLIDCIVDQTVTNEVALQHITLGIRELHSMCQQLLCRYEWANPSGILG
jgi:hypothetical protein